MDRAQAEAIRDEVLRRNDPVTGAVLLGEMFLTDPEFFEALHGREIAPGVHIQNPGPDPNRMTEKLIRRVQASAADYVDGIRNPRRDPVQAAVRAAGKWGNKVQEAVQGGYYEKGVRSQNYAEAVETAVADGGAAFVAGVAKRERKIARVFQDLAPRMGALSQAIQQMPQDNAGQREQRLLAALRGMIAIGKARKGSAGVGAR
jgi:hypothetical protein